METDRLAELENTKICRICLNSSEEETFYFDIFASNNDCNASSLPMQILSVGAVEVYPNDGMPRKICKICKSIMSNSFKFKQICKRADTLLKMYPMTGKLPAKIQLPEELLPPEPASSVIIEKACKVKFTHSCTQTEEEEYESKEVVLEQEEDDKQYHFIEYKETDVEASDVSLIAPPPFFDDPPTPPTPPKIKVKIESVKILNKSSDKQVPKLPFKRSNNMKIEKVFKSPKILNSAFNSFQPNLENPIVEETLDGNIQIITGENNEYLLEVEDQDQEQDEECFTMESPMDAKIEIVETHVFACTMCERSFPLSQLLEIHVKNHIRERNHPCDLCDKSFFSKYDLAKHNLIHTGQKDYKCIVCNKSFSRSTLLYRHEKIHVNAEKFTCSECARSYLNEEDYLKHIQTHTKARKFKCNYCDKKFAFKQGLERHEVIHAIDQPFACEYCELRFPSASKLSRHLTQHAGTRPFPCKVCNKSFMLSHHLSRHARTSHQHPGNYQCTICSQIFEDRSNYFDHCTTHAVESLQCPLCKINFDDIDQVTAHLTLHNENEEYSCDYCDMVFLDQDYLEKHFIDQHNNEICSIAGGEETIEFIVYGDHVKAANDYSRKPKRKVEGQNSFEIPSSKMKLVEVSDLIEHQQDNEVDITEQYDISGDGVGFTIETLEDGSYMEYTENVQEEITIPKVVKEFKLPKGVSITKTELPSPPQPAKKSKFVIPKKAQIPTKQSPVKQQPTEVKILPAQKHYNVKPPVYETRKMMPAEIEKLKAEGKIMFRDGKMILKRSL